MKGKIKISYNDEKKFEELALDKSRKVFTSPSLDTTIIQIKEHELNRKCLELDENILKNKNFINELYNKKPIYLLEHLSNKIYSSYGILESINNNEIIHKCSTRHGSSGSPILSLYNNKVIGMHRGGSSTEESNKGILLNKSINEFLKLLNLEKKDEPQNNINSKNKLHYQHSENKVLVNTDTNKFLDTTSNLENNNKKLELKKPNEIKKDYVIVFTDEDSIKREIPRISNLRQRPSINTRYNQPYSRQSNSASRLLNDNIKSNRKLNNSTSKQDNFKYRNQSNNSKDNFYNERKLNTINNLETIKKNLNNNIFQNNLSQTRNKNILNYSNASNYSNNIKYNETNNIYNNIKVNGCGDNINYINQQNNYPMKINDINQANNYSTNNYINYTNNIKQDKIDNHIKYYNINFPNANINQINNNQNYIVSNNNNLNNYMYYYNNNG